MWTAATWAGSLEVQGVAPDQREKKCQQWGRRSDQRVTSGKQIIPAKSLASGQTGRHGRHVRSMARQRHGPLDTIRIVPCMGQPACRSQAPARLGRHADGPLGTVGPPGTAHLAQMRPKN